MSTYFNNERIKLAHPDQFFIGGKWIAAATNATIELISPATELVIGRVAEAAEEDVNRAVAAARHAFDHGPWPHMKPAERAGYIKRLAEELRKRTSELAYANTDQMGLPIKQSLGAAAAVINGYDYCADLHTKVIWEERQPTAHPGSIGLLVREPVGVVVAIVPWNGPLFTLTTKLAPALLAGCTVIVKPSPETPLEAFILCECAEAAGFPPGVINLIVADRDVSDYLVRQPGVDKVSFTGSTAAGKRIGEVCAQRVARATLELGGKSAALVLDDYDLEKAATALGSASCRNSGHVCSNLTRYFVSEANHDTFVGHLATVLKSIKVGDPYADDTQMGPIANKRQFEKIQYYVDLGIKEGAKLVTGGKRLAGFERGYYYEPTLFASVDNRSTIAQEEIFGPVIAVIPYKNLDHAIDMANDSDFGLNSAVFTNDNKLAYQVARRLRAGTVGHNGYKTDFNIGFGGFKQSGIGREGGVAGVLSFLESKTVIMAGEYDAS